MLRTPGFWRRRGPLAWLLSPLGALYKLGGRFRQRFGQPKAAPIPVLCVGNAVVGGSGKTPVVLSLVELLRDMGHQPHILSRGYGGRSVTRTPRLVRGASDSALEVGDEPLMLAASAPTWVGRDRVASAFATAEAGATIAIMDDGWQSPRLRKDINLLVLDGAYGVGNGFGLPAGPLRESWPAALSRADAVVLYGRDEHGLLAGSSLPVFPAAMEADAKTRAHWAGRRVFAFAGIGRPEKFFATLEALGAQVLERRAFPDHRYYTEEDIRNLLERARSLDAIPVTTEKDWTRMGQHAGTIEYLAVRCVWKEEQALREWLAQHSGGTPQSI